MKDRVAKSVFWLVWSRGALQAVSFLSTIFVARLLNPNDYGLMALASVWTSVLGLLSEAGLGAAIIQFRDLDEEDLNACFWLTMSVAGVGYLLLYMAAPAIARWFDSPALTPVLRVGGLTLPLLAVRVVPDSLLRKQIRLDRVSQVEILSTVITIPVVVGLAWAGTGVWALVAGSLVTASVQSVLVFWFIPWRPGSPLGGKRFKEMLRFSLAALGSQVCWALYEQADVVVLGKVDGKVTVGIYSMAKEFATLPVNKVTAVVNQLTFPMMAELQENQAALQDSLLRGIRFVAWVTFPLCIGLLLVAKDLVPVVLTEKWAPAVPVIEVLCVYALVRSVGVLLPPVLMAKYRARFLFVYSLTQLGIMPLAFWVGASWWGATGVAAAWVIVYPLVMARMAREALREADISFDELWLQLRAPAAATLTMVAAVLLIRWAMTPPEGGLEALRLAITVLIGAIVYSTVLWKIGGPVRAELQEVAGWIFAKEEVSSRA